MPTSIHLKKYNSPKEAAIALEELTREFIKVNKRAPKSSLVYSSIGLKEKEAFSLAIWPETGKIGEEEAAWFANKLNSNK